MLDYKDIMVAQQRYEDLRREAAQQNRNSEMLGSAQSSAVQYVASLVASMKRRMARTEAEAKPVGNAMPSKVA